MTQINLPTYEQQEAIKQDTQNILAQFPISGGTDFSKLTFGSNTTLSSHYNYKVIEINGSGFLTSLSIANSTAFFSIQVDDKAIYRIEAYGGYASLLVRFNTNLKVYVETSNRSQAAYLLD